MNGIDYNTERPLLTHPEYGRIVQNMLNHCLTIENKTERTKAAKAIIDIMCLPYPQQKNSQEFKQKLYGHLAVMSNFKLDIDWELGISTQDINRKPERVNYSLSNVKYRHYGSFVELTLKKIPEIEDINERNALIEMIGNYMKRLIFQWKKEQVPDEIIFNDMKHISKNSFEIPEGFVLKECTEVSLNVPMQNNQSQQQQKKKRKKKRNKNKIFNGN